MRLTPRELGEADAGLITRLENRLARLEERKAATLADIGRARARSSTPAPASVSPSLRPPSSPRPATAPAGSTKNSSR